MVLALLLVLGAAPPDASEVIGKDRRVVETTIAVEAHPLDMAMAPDGALYVGVFGAGKIAEIRNRQVVRTAAVGTGPTGVAISKDGARLWVGLGNENAIALLDTATLAVKKKVKTCRFPIGMRLSPDETWIGVVCNQSGALAVLPAALDDPGVTVAVGANPYYVAITPDSSRAFVSCFGSNALAAVSVDAGRTLSASVEKSIPVGGNPVGVAVTADGARVYTANWSSSSVTVIDTRTLQVSETLPAGLNPYWVAAHPEHDLVLVSNHGARKLDVFHGGGRRTRIAVQDAVTAVFLAPDGKRIYTTVWGHAAVSIIE